jgi:hypothetical protein
VSGPTTCPGCNDAHSDGRCCRCGHDEHRRPPPSAKVGRVACLEAPADHEGRVKHAWVNTGLDVVDDMLMKTRECAWCFRQEQRHYRNQGPWKAAP